MINIIKKLQNYIECLIFINKCYVNIVTAIVTATVTVIVINQNIVNVIDTDILINTEILKYLYTELHKTYFFNI